MISTIIANLVIVHFALAQPLDQYVPCCGMSDFDIWTVTHDNTPLSAGANRKRNDETIFASVRTLGSLTGFTVLPVQFSDEMSLHTIPKWIHSNENSFPSRVQRIAFAPLKLSEPSESIIMGVSHDEKLMMVGRVPTNLDASKCPYGFEYALVNIPDGSVITKRVFCVTLPSRSYSGFVRSGKHIGYVLNSSVQSNLNDDLLGVTETGEWNKIDKLSGCAIRASNDGQRFVLYRFEESFMSVECRSVKYLNVIWASRLSYANPDERSVPYTCWSEGDEIIAVEMRGPTPASRVLVFDAANGLIVGEYVGNGKLGELNAEGCSITRKDLPVDLFKVFGVTTISKQ